MIHTRNTSETKEERYDLFSSLLKANSDNEGDAKLSTREVLGVHFGYQLEDIHVRLTGGPCQEIFLYSSLLVMRFVLRMTYALTLNSATRRLGIPYVSHLHCWHCTRMSKKAFISTSSSCSLMAGYQSVSNTDLFCSQINTLFADI